MQFSKKVSQLARLYNVEPKDVLFAMLTTAGASAAEAFAVIYRPAASTNNALSSKASIYISQRPGLQRLQAALLEECQTEQTAKRGRPRKNNTPEQVEERATINYNDKDALLKELARLADRSDKDSDKLAALREIAALQRMKQEQNTAEEKRVHYYVPLTYKKCDELRTFLVKYYEEKGVTV